jgi:hypothetical protein
MRWIEGVRNLSYTKRTYADGFIHTRTHLRQGRLEGSGAQDVGEEETKTQVHVLEEDVDACPWSIG